MELPFYSALEKRLGKAKKSGGIDIPHHPIFFGGASLVLLAFVFMTGPTETAIQFALFLAPLWLPPLLLAGAWKLWIILKQSEFIAGQDMILLEVRPPRSVEKTPLAMETVFAGMHHSPGEGTWYGRLIQGKVRPWWSLELVSIEGQVHFFIWTRKGFRRIIESNIYAQYPGAQVTEVSDYSRMTSASPEEWNIWGCEFVHTQPDPVPIKTYVEYGLDKVQKEHEQVDPLANLTEFLGSMRKGENIWLQLVIRVHKGDKYADGVTVNDPKTKQPVTKHPKDWKEYARMLIEEIRSATVGKMKYKDIFSGEEREMDSFPNPTKGESEKMAAIERNVSKQAFDVGARILYLAKPDAFDPITISGVTGIFRQFSSEGWNGFKPSGGMTKFDDYPWERNVNKRKNIAREELVDSYRRRMFYYEPYDMRKETMVMSIEELATIFHIPSRAVETPTLGRVPSATGEAPANLPV